MEIRGHGLIATALHAYRDRLPDVLAFAKGVATSAPLQVAAYDREARDLYEAIEDCRRDGRRLIYFSSGGSIYGPSEEPRAEDDALFPVNAYGRHQVVCETVIRMAEVRHLIVRLPNVVGSGRNPAQLVPALVAQCLDGRVTVFADATRDLIGVDDTARLVVRLLEVAPDAGTVQVASGISSPVPALVAEVQRILGTSALEEVRPGGDRQGFATDRLVQLLGDEATFAADYPTMILRRYVPDIARRLRLPRDKPDTTGGPEPRPGPAAGG
jgi:nucleoside-diphosphate-sugar epimerase